MNDSLAHIFKDMTAAILAVFLLKIVGDKTLEATAASTRRALWTVMPCTLAIIVGLPLAFAIPLGFAALVPITCLGIMWVLRRFDSAVSGFRIEPDLLHLALAVLAALLLGLPMQSSATEFSEALGSHSLGVWIWGPMATITVLGAFLATTIADVLAFEVATWTKHRLR